MKRRHHTPDQIVRKLREDDWMLGEGTRWWRCASTRRHGVDLLAVAKPVRRDEYR